MTKIDDVEGLLQDVQYLKDRLAISTASQRKLADTIAMTPSS
jgi:hypothetical protein